MQRFLLIFVMVITVLSLNVNASLDEVHLDLDTGEKFEYEKFETKIDSMDINEEESNEDYIYNPMKYVKDEAKELYTKKTVTNKKEKTFGKATLGAKYDTTFAPDSMSQKRTLYSNYNMTDKMTVGTTYETDSLSGAEAQTKGTVGIGPEYQLNQKLKLKNKYSKNFGNNSNKGELSVEYKPFKDGRMDFSAGAAQIQQDDGTGSRSQVNFGTNFRF